MKKQYKKINRDFQTKQSILREELHRLSVFHEHYYNSKSHKIVNDIVKLMFSNIPLIDSFSIDDEYYMFSRVSGIADDLNLNFSIGLTTELIRTKCCQVRKHIKQQ